jgi:hypothetical protein
MHLKAVFSMFYACADQRIMEREGGVNVVRMVIAHEARATRAMRCDSKRFLKNHQISLRERA